MTSQKFKCIPRLANLNNIFVSHFLNAIRNVIRIGIIGCGRIATRHIEACLSSTHVDLTVLVDPVEKHARSVADRFNITPYIKSNIDHALEHMDAAIIATPNHLHKETAIRCLETGISTLIEKPLATSVSDGEEICRVARDNNVTAAVGYVTRFRESVQLMRELLKTRYFGKIYRFAYQSGTKGGWTPLSNYNLDRTATGGGVLVVTGTHFLDRLLYWFGYPDIVGLQHDSIGGPEANAHAVFEYKRDSLNLNGTARFSKTVSLPSGFVMDTETGTVFLGDSNDAAIEFYPSATPDLKITLSSNTPKQQTPAGKPENLFKIQIENFVSSIQLNTFPMTPAEEGVQSLRLLNDLYANSTSGLNDWNTALRLKEVLQ